MGKKRYLISNAARQAIIDSQSEAIKKISKVSCEKTTNDLVNFEKPREQIEIIRSFLIDEKVSGKKLLEIGSGLGIFNIVARSEFGIDAWGVEPSVPGYTGSYAISKMVIRDNGLTFENILDAVGERLPFKNNSFDIVYSTNVLEHVADPKAVLSEALRVCRPGGLIQIVVPNYGSFFDGHYACFYLPYQPLWLWKMWLRIVLRRDTSFTDTLRTEINYFSIKRWLKQLEAEHHFEILSYGKEIFKQRFISMDFNAWAGLTKVASWLRIVHALRLTYIVLSLLIGIKAYSPIILSIRKK